MTTIIVDGQAYSGRAEVASLLSRDLHCSLIGAEQLAKWAERRGYDGEELVERLEQPYGFFRRLGDVLARAMTYSRMGTLASPDSPPAYFPSPSIYADGEVEGSGARSRLSELAMPLDTRRMRKILPSLLLENIGPGHAVVVGCGAQGALKDASDVLKVFLVAPLELRAVRASLELEIGLDEARRRVQRVDNARRCFLKQVFALTWDDTHTHDLHLDTSTLAYGDVVGLILKMMAEAPAAFEEEDLEATG